MYVEEALREIERLTALTMAQRFWSEAKGELFLNMVQQLRKYHAQAQVEHEHERKMQPVDVGCKQ